MAVNLIGCFAAGAIFYLTEERFLINPAVRTVILIGLLGGFTTFSTFSLDAALLIERHSLGAAAGYMVGSVVACLSALFFGLAVFRSAGHLP